MLLLKNIKKSYKVGEIITTALKGISVSFREKEFVAILGKSGSGKTTALNIIGGLDRYDSGDLIIKGKSTNKFKDKDWDAYRNNSIGFVFQSYNLINHLSIVDNVELGMTLSGVDNKTKHKKAIDVLKKVGLEEHLHKKPNQLSGGQQQRVAIARALVNDPEILLCDEPTGALDTATSKQIMDLIKAVASERLVIMVTHNPDLAKEYADRIVEFEDGTIVSDSNSYTEMEMNQKFELKHTKMSFFTALKLSFNNIRTKLGRTTLTSFASSIGIIGIAVILSLSTGFQLQIDEYQESALSEYPIIISKSAVNLSEEALEEQRNEAISNNDDERVDSDEVYLYNSSESEINHQNKLSNDFITYLQEIDSSYATSIGYSYALNLNLLRDTGEGVVPVSLSTGNSSGTQLSSLREGASTYPINLDQNQQTIIEKNYELLAGSYPSSETDLLIVTNSKNQVDTSVLEAIGYDTTGIDSIKFEDLIGVELKWIPNDLYYEKTDFGNYVQNTDYESYINDSNVITLKIAGIIRQDSDSQVNLIKEGIVYSDSLSQKILEQSMDSEIVQEQSNVDYNVLTMQPITETERNTILMVLGGDDEPVMITVYPKDFLSTENIATYLDDYNIGKDNEEIVIYTNLASTITGLTKNIMDGITVVLIAFASISLVVSLIMIGIITYTSVLERTKEIGILKALGARKKDITRVFDAETFILGVFSGVLGVVIAYLLTFPINQIIYAMTELTNVAQLQVSHAVILVTISTTLTVLGGHIPARMASKKDAVTALRSE